MRNLLTVKVSRGSCQMQFKYEVADIETYGAGDHQRMLILTPNKSFFHCNLVLLHVAEFNSILEPPTTKC